MSCYTSRLCGPILLSSKSNNIPKVEMLIAINVEALHESRFSTTPLQQLELSLSFNFIRISAVVFLQIAISIHSATGLFLSFEFELDKPTPDWALTHLWTC